MKRFAFGPFEMQRESFPSLYLRFWRFVFMYWPNAKRFARRFEFKFE